MQNHDIVDANKNYDDHLAILQTVTAQRSVATLNGYQMQLLDQVINPPNPVMNHFDLSFDVVGYPINPMIRMLRRKINSLPAVRKYKTRNKI